MQNVPVTEHETHFIYCLVDPRDNSYDYSLNGAWTKTLEGIALWDSAGVGHVVALDPLSMAIVYRFTDHAEFHDYVTRSILDSEVRC